MTASQIVRAIRTPITLVILLGLLGFGAWWGYRMIVEGVRPALPDPCVTVEMAELTPASVVVRVYNGGPVRGLANNVAKGLRQAGYMVVNVGNSDEKIDRVVIVGVSVDSPEVLLVAARFNDPIIRADQRPDHSVDVLVGAAPLDPNPEPPGAIVLPSGQACLPRSAVPTPEPSPPTEEPGPDQGGTGETGAAEGGG
ncbi:MAG: LytR C-terminal domain-containing protein [Propionibacteriaceae bacterium]|nr:LytR C-terminal domain-containing protein [Propionibacteriaceae bacterium]